MKAGANRIPQTKTDGIAQIDEAGHSIDRDSIIFIDQNLVLVKLLGLSELDALPICSICWLLRATHSLHFKH